MKITFIRFLLLPALVPVAGLQAQRNYATPYTITTVAGESGTGSADGTGGAAKFWGPYAVAVDASGNVYVCDTNNQTIRKITPAGMVTTLAGTAGRLGYFDATGADAWFDYPQGVAADSAGNVYVADSGNNAIRKITPAGVVSTFAGMGGSFGYGYADGTGSAARFNQPWGVAVDSADNIYVADSGNNLIRKITPGAVVTTVAGTRAAGADDGPGASATFNLPTALTVDADGTVYVADVQNGVIRKITISGTDVTVSTLAGLAGSGGSDDGTGANARFGAPVGVTVDADQNVYVADQSNNAIRKITPGGVVTTFAGTAAALFGGATDGTGGAARFVGPRGVAADSAGNVFVADTDNCTIRKITPAAVVTTFAGRAAIGAEDGPVAGARFFNAQGIAFDSANNAYVADTNNNTIRKITPGGLVSTFAGSSTADPGSADGTGAAARFFHPCALAVDGADTVYVADTLNYTIRKITPGGDVSTFAGTAGQVGSTDGVGSAARFNFCRGIALDGAGNVYVSDTSNNTIRKITPDGTVTTLAGLAGSPGSTNGTGSAARFSNPYGLTVDPSGNVFVADSSNRRIRQITAAGVVTTLAGSGGSGSLDAQSTGAQFILPRGITRDATGNLYVADYLDSVIRKISPTGLVSTVAGDFTIVGQADGTGQVARFSQPQGLAFDNAGLLYVADVTNCAIRRGAQRIDGDFNSDRLTDIVWQNSTTGERGFWMMDGTTFSSWLDIGPISTALKIVGVGDFNGDGKSDIIWENTTTGKRVIWFMNGTTFLSSYNIGIISTDWHIAAVGDFTGNGPYNCDGKPDILWQNTATGDCGFWQMDGTAFVNWLDMGVMDSSWRIVGAGDLNGDGHPDIVWENTVTGDRGFWLMYGFYFQSWVDIGVISTDWHIASVADYNGDGQPDILWENTATGDRGFWLMNGTTFSSWVDIGIIATDWRIAQ